MDVLFSLTVPLLPLGSLWGIVRHGPWRNPWHKREHPIGFALAVGAASFLAGFVGPMVLAPHANQGPLLGILITGPLGLLAGLVWGAARAWGRRGATH